MGSIWIIIWNYFRAGLGRLAFFNPHRLGFTQIGVPPSTDLGGGKGASPGVARFWPLEPFPAVFRLLVNSTPLIATAAAEKASSRLIRIKKTP
jgi:hypothetical protein